MDNSDQGSSVDEIDITPMDQFLFNDDPNAGLQCYYDNNGARQDSSPARSPSAMFDENVRDGLFASENNQIYIGHDLPPESQHYPEQIVGQNSQPALQKAPAERDRGTASRYAAPPADPVAVSPADSAGSGKYQAVGCNPGVDDDGASQYSLTAGMNGGRKRNHSSMSDKNNYGESPPKSSAAGGSGSRQLSDNVFSSVRASSGYKLKTDGLHNSSSITPSVVTQPVTTNSNTKIIPPEHLLLFNQNQSQQQVHVKVIVKSTRDFENVISVVPIDDVRQKAFKDVFEPSVKDKVDYSKVPSAVTATKVTDNAMLPTGLLVALFTSKLSRPEVSPPIEGSYVPAIVLDGATLFDLRTGTRFRMPGKGNIQLVKVLNAKSRKQLVKAVEMAQGQKKGIMPEKYKALPIYVDIHNRAEFDRFQVGEEYWLELDVTDEQGHHPLLGWHPLQRYPGP